MSRRSLYKNNNQSDQINIFQSFSDLMANAFMVLCFLLFLALIHAQYVNNQLKKNKLSNNVQAILNLNKQLERQLKESLSINKELQELNQRLQSASPIIIDESSGNFKFQSGSAELKPEFKKYLQNNVLVQIRSILKDKKEQIDFIQVIGHTDGEGIDQDSNLDKTLEIVAQGRQPVSELSAGSNADLGLMRALAVVQELQNTGLKNVEFRAYSAAQLYLPNGNLAPINRQSDETRRRIEIRFIPPALKRN